MISLHKRARSFLALGWLLLQLGTVVHAAELEGTEETLLDFIDQRTGLRRFGRIRTECHPGEQ